MESLSRPEEALQDVKRGLDSGILQIAPYSVLAGDLFMAQANALNDTYKVESALPALQRAYQIYVATRQPRNQAIALLNIGSIYLTARDYPQALRYYSQAIDRYPGDQALTMAAHGNRGQALLLSGNALAAKEEFRDVARLAGSLKNIPIQQQYLGNLAYAELLSLDIREADVTLRKAYALTAPDSAGEHHPALDWIAAELALRQNLIPRAVKLINNLLANVDLAKTTVQQRDALRTAYQVYKAAGDDRQALVYLEAYKQADDKARSIAASANAALMSARFDFVNQQAQIRQLHAVQQSQAAAARAKLRDTILNAVVTGSGIVFALLLFGYVSIRRSRDQVRAANDDLSTSNTALEKALAARTEFLAMTSHEIRTPLNGILGMTQVLLADRALAPPVRGKIELVHGAGETMKSLVDDLLDVAKMTTGEITIHKAEMDLARLLRDAGQVWSGQAESRGIGLVLAVDAAPARIVEDEVRLRQIVFNLMSNAIKFTDRGDVRLTVEIADSGDGERLRLAIADSGIGIPGAQLEEIFESFRQVDSGVTRRHGGTGLGLSICRSLARAMGGDVTVASTVGTGSTFIVDLPLERVAAPEAAPQRAQSATMLAEARVLLVEANPIMQSIMRSVLDPQVAGIEIVAGGIDAERVLAASPIDLVLADGAALGLDPKVAGALACAAAGQGARTVLLWPAPDEAVRAAVAQQADIALLVAKPIGAADLVGAIKSLYTPLTPAEIAA